MTDTTCNGWRNAATWTVNLWFGDGWSNDAADGNAITAETCREMVEQYVEDILSIDAHGGGNFIWDMLDLNSVDWDALASHHAPIEGDAA